MSKLANLRIDSPPPQPRRRRHFPWFPVVFFLFIVIAGIWVFRDALAGIGNPSGKVAAGAKTAAVEPPVTERNEPPGSISAAGYLEVIPPGPQIASASVGGMVEDIFVKPGDSVLAGQVVAVLDTAPLLRQRALLASRVEIASTRLLRAAAGSRAEEIEQARAAVDGARAGLDLALADLSRAEELFTQGVIAGQELDTRVADADLARSSLNRELARLELLQAGAREEDVRIAEAELAGARTELANLDWEIDQCRISVPSDGVVLELYAQPGDWLSPGTDNPRSSAVLACFDPRKIQAWVDVNQRDSAGLVVGQAVELTTDALPERSVPGIVSGIMPQANLQKNTVQVKITIPDPPADFRPELSVKVVFKPVNSKTGAQPEVSDEQ